MHRVVHRVEVLQEEVRKSEESRLKRRWKVVDGVEKVVVVVDVGAHEEEGKALRGAKKLLNLVDPVAAVVVELLEDRWWVFLNGIDLGELKWTKRIEVETVEVVLRESWAVDLVEESRQRSQSSSNQVDHDL